MVRFRKLSDEQLTEMRERRAAGEKLAALAVDFGVSAGCVCKRTRGVPRPAGIGEQPRVRALVEAVAAELGQPPDWAEAARRERAHPGRPSRLVTLARRATAVALEQLGLTKRQIGRFLFHDPNSGALALQAAETDPEAQKLALVALFRLETDQARAAA